jgi:flagellar L-ring protein precursor FlgH
MPEAPAKGSLYSDATAKMLYEDRKAGRVGDILTVQLREATTSSKSSNTEVKKETEVSIPEAAGGLGTILGSQVSLKEFSLLTNLAAERQFNGEADADQRNRLQGDISVTVVDVYPNGTLVVRGEKWMTLNHGDEFIRISGLVRPEDVRPDNTVVSTKIANARISYSGTGTLADSQQMGWLARFFNHPVWPF